MSLKNLGNLEKANLKRPTVFPEYLTACEHIFCTSAFTSGSKSQNEQYHLLNLKIGCKVVGRSFF